MEYIQLRSNIQFHRNPISIVRDDACEWAQLPLCYSLHGNRITTDCHHSDASRIRQQSIKLPVDSFALGLHNEMLFY